MSPASQNQRNEARAVARTPAAAAALVLGPRLIDLQRAAAEVGAVERQRLLGLLRVAELDETEPLGLARVPVRDHASRVGRAELGEHVVELVVGNVVREVTYVELHRIILMCRAFVGENTAGAGLRILVCFRSGFVRTGLAKASEARTRPLYHRIRPMGVIV